MSSSLTCAAPTPPPPTPPPPTTTAIYYLYNSRILSLYLSSRNCACAAILASENDSTHFPSRIRPANAANPCTEVLLNRKYFSKLRTAGRTCSSNQRGCDATT